MIPGMAKAAKAHRQPMSWMTHTISSGVIAPPQREHSHMTLTPRLRSRAGSQLVKALARLGKAPASAAPKRNCAVTREARPQARPVAAVKNDQRSTIAVKTRRGPFRSPANRRGLRTRRKRPCSRRRRSPSARWRGPIGGDVGLGLGHADAVDVDDDGQGRGENGHPMAGVRGTAGVGGRKRGGGHGSVAGDRSAGRHGEGGQQRQIAREIQGLTRKNRKSAAVGEPERFLGPGSTRVPATLRP